MNCLVYLHGPSQRAHARELIEAAPQGTVLAFRPPTRSLEQNAKMWAMLSDISKAKPEGREHTPEVWKCLFMQACGHEVQFVPGLSGLPFPIGFRSSKLSKAQASELIEFILAWGTERGVPWSDEARA